MTGSAPRPRPDCGGEARQLRDFQSIQVLLEASCPSVALIVLRAEADAGEIEEGRSYRALQCPPGRRPLTPRFSDSKKTNFSRLVLFGFLSAVKRSRHKISIVLTPQSFSLLHSTDIISKTKLATTLSFLPPSTSPRDRSCCSFTFRHVSAQTNHCSAWIWGLRSGTRA
ncbi:unnamed protein product [Ixodes pacificus]